MIQRVFVLMLVAWSTLAYAQTNIPELWGSRVHDEAHVLSPGKIESLELQLKVFEDSTSNQIAILIINTLGDDVLEDYSLRVAEKWKLGQQEKDNGVLLLIALDDHKMRIETGQGLEGVLPDVICNRIIRNEIAPAFRQNDYDGGVQAGIDAIIKATRHEYVSTDSDESNSGNTDLSIGERFFIGAFIFGILGIFSVVAMFAKGCAGWFLYAFLIPFYAVFPWVAVGTTAGTILFFIYLIGFPISKLIIARTSWGRRMAQTFANPGSGGRSGGGGFGGGFLSGGGGGWSSGGGGFSGGGGSFGGGGSSGSW